MAKYVKKPIVIEAFRFDGAITRKHPQWAIDACEKGGIIRVQTDTIGVKTLEGWLTARVGDYIVRGMKGELYPVRADIFEETYALVEENMLGCCPYCWKELREV